MDYKKTYKFAAITSSAISLFILVMILPLQLIFFYFSWKFTLIVFLLSLIFSFLLIQYRAEKFIYDGIKKIYEDVSILQSSSLRKERITTDMNTLTQQVKKFATDKKLEIETLKLQEEYRREFIGNVAHELKTPLFTVQGYLLTLLDGAINDKSVRKKYLQRAEKGVERLANIIQELDMITSFEAGTLSIYPEVFNIVEVVENVFDLLEIKASKKNIILMFDMKYIEPIYVNADKEKITRIIINLIENSIKYGRENGTTEISIENLTENKIILRVIDNGEGIDKSNITRIFERFYRIDKSGSRKEGGSGLGLAIVKHIIEAHDEKIFVKSELNKGSEFAFTLEKHQQ